jgi:JmjC domain, hydroxylase
MRSRYGVPAAAASDFEEAFKATKPELFVHQPDVLFHLVTMLSPRILQKNAVPVHTVLQQAGEFVITFPNAYHGGFNHGVNAAEAVCSRARFQRCGSAGLLHVAIMLQTFCALRTCVCVLHNPPLPMQVNFVPADWMRFGAASMLRYRAFRKPSVLCHEQLLLDVVNEGGPRTKFWAARELERAVTEEAQLRYNLWAAVRTRRFPNHSRLLPSFLVFHMCMAAFPCVVPELGSACDVAGAVRLKESSAGDSY